MKTVKILLKIVLSFSVIAIVIFTVQGIKSKDKTDPLDNILTEDNYPFNGYFSENSTVVDEQSLAQMLSAQKDIAKYAKDIKINIQADRTLMFSCTLQNIRALLDSDKTLKGYKMWASAFEGQQITATIAAQKDADGHLGLSLSTLSVGQISLDPDLLSGVLGSDVINKQIGKIPYESVAFSDGEISFALNTPKFFEQCV